MAERDTVFMQRALELARLGRGLVSPNPMVGAVVVQDDRIVGEGYHRYDRLRHAESYALEEAGEQSRGAVLYCTLEPCCHFGRTPPCTDAVIAAGVTRAVVATIDPDHRVAGEGVRRLIKAGLSVPVGLCGDEAARLNEIYLKHVTDRVPFLHVVELGTDTAAKNRRGLLEVWRPSSAFIDQVIEYDALVLSETGPWASSILASYLKRPRHRPLVVVGPADTLNQLGGGEALLDVSWISTSRAEIQNTQLLLERLAAFGVTSTLVVRADTTQRSAATLRADKITLILERGETDLRINVDYANEDGLAGLVELTGYPRETGTPG